MALDVPARGGACVGGWVGGALAPASADTPTRVRAQTHSHPPAPPTPTTTHPRKASASPAAHSLPVRACRLRAHTGSGEGGVWVWVGGGGGGSKGGSAAPQQCNTHPHKPPTPPRRAPLTPHSRLCDLVIHRAVPHGHECRQYKGGLVTGGTCQLGQGQVARVCKGRRGEGVVGGRQGGAGGASGGQAGRQAAADGAQATNKQAEPHQ